MNNPEYVIINNKKIKINTDYRVALRCNRIAEDETISNYERAMAILYLLYGDIVFDDDIDKEKLLKLSIKYLSCNQENNNSNDEKKDMDYEQDYSLIKASFMTDYNIDLNVAKIHWWDFFDYLNGLTDKCILNRVRELRNENLNDYKDEKTREKIRKQQEYFALNKKEVKLTEEQKNNVNKFYELTGIKRKE